MAAYGEIWEYAFEGEIRMPFGGSADFMTWSKDERGANYNEVDERAIERCTLAKAAPDMCRALLSVEWSAKPQLAMCWCACCVGEVPNHDATCALDMALTKAGLPDQASRDAARKELGL